MAINKDELLLQLKEIERNEQLELAKIVLTAENKPFEFGKEYFHPFELFDYDIFKEAYPIENWNIAKVDDEYYIVEKTEEESISGRRTRIADLYSTCDAAVQCVIGKIEQQIERYRSQIIRLEAGQFEVIRR